MDLILRKIAPDYDGNTLLGMNGGQPESPDGKRLVYARKSSLTDQETEIFVCDRDTLTNHRKICTTHSGNHNGPSQTFVDNHHIVYRDGINKLSCFWIINVDTGNVKYGPIFGKESHCAENGIYPFSISEEFLGANPDHPEIDKCGIYLLNLSDGSIKRVADKDTIYNMVVEHGCVPDQWTTSMSHVQLNPDATKVMMRLSVANCPVFGALGGIDLVTGETFVIKDKPVHQLWYDNNTYLATRQYVVNEKIDMATSRIERFSMDGECLEILGGVGNHIDGSPDRQWFTGDRAYPDYQTDVFLYKRGCIEPVATFGGTNFQHCTWKLKVHPNPTFSRDGKRIYFNHVTGETTTEALYADISEIVSKG